MTNIDVIEIGDLHMLSNNPDHVANHWAAGLGASPTGYSGLRHL